MKKAQKRFKYTADQQDLIESFLQSDMYEPLLMVLEDLNEDATERVLLYNLSNGPEGLVIEKARAEGSARLLLELRRYRDRVLKEKRAN